MVERIVGMWHGVCNMPGTGSPTTLDVFFRLASTSFFLDDPKMGRGEKKKLMTGDARLLIRSRDAMPIPPYKAGQAQDPFLR